MRHRHLALPYLALAAAGFVVIGSGPAIAASHKGGDNPLAMTSTPSASPTSPALSRGSALPAVTPAWGATATLTATTEAASTTAAPTGNEPTSSPTSTGGSLEFPPPKLASPTTITVTKGGTVTLDQPGDYVIDLPDDKAIDGQLTIDGKNTAGNVAIIGGEIHNPGHGAMVAKGITGDLYMEGVVLGDGQGVEGIDLDNRQQKGNTTLQNVDIKKVIGLYSGTHADLVQQYGGGKDSKLILARVKGETTYQGVMFQPEKFGDPIAENVIHDSVFTHDGSGGYGGVFLTSAGKKVPRDWKNFTVVSDSSKPMIYPDSTIDSEPGAKVTSSEPASPLVGTPGPGYVSPGYQQ